jgi:hypothetical protein
VGAAEEVCVWVGGKFGLLERLLLLLLLMGINSVEIRCITSFKECS